MRKIIELGYYHPSQANWSYHIFMVIDKTGARLYRSTFSSDYNLTEKYKIEKLSAGKGTGVEYKWRDIKDLLDIVVYDGKNWGGNK